MRIAVYENKIEKNKKIKTNENKQNARGRRGEETRSPNK